MSHKVTHYSLEILHHYPKMYIQHTHTHIGRSDPHSMFTISKEKRYQILAPDHNQQQMLLA